MSNKRIISCAITGGIHSPTMSEYLPATPEQIAQSAIEAASAGAAVVHIHARDPQNGKPSAELEHFQFIVDKIKAANDDVIICLTTGGALGMTLEQRTHYIPHIKPELASMNCGSINWGLFPLGERIKDWKHDWEKSYYTSKEVIFPNTFGAMEDVLNLFKANNVTPELECYDVGHLYNLKFMIDRGHVTSKPYIQFVLGINGALGSTPYDLITMKQTADRLFGEGGYNFSAFGAGRASYPICTQILFMGGHVRVGMEDNLYISKGVKAKSNAEMVEKMVRIMGEFSYEPMTPTEAREALGLKK
ncbi:MAG: 3-keto-5-aminohexanoate cleavage protein [Defluviitaleaceae bacterium]|nr:3-keto-5-aminohexanoate cleavage protein [Defluviitaleaceae bacterium]